MAHMSTTWRPCVLMTASMTPRCYAQAASRRSPTLALKSPPIRISPSVCAAASLVAIVANLSAALTSLKLCEPAGGT